MANDHWPCLNYEIKSSGSTFDRWLVWKDPVCSKAWNALNLQIKVIALRQSFKVSSDQGFHISAGGNNFLLQSFKLSKSTSLCRRKLLWAAGSSFKLLLGKTKFSKAPIYKIGCNLWAWGVQHHTRRFAKENQINWNYHQHLKTTSYIRDVKCCDRNPDLSGRWCGLSCDGNSWRYSVREVT